MRSIGRLAILGMVLLVALSPVMLGAPARLSAQAPVSYTDVTDSRLLNPEPQNWLMYRGNYSGWGYSPLDRITPANVKKLVPVWSFSTGVTEGHQSPPIVNNGVMFVTTPQQQVIALNAKTGDVLWRYKKELPEDLLQLHPTNRGVGLYEDKVYIGTVDAHVVALDAKTGKVVWDKAVDDYKKGYYFTLAPLVAKGKVMVGTSGGELGIRGYIAALDARTGQRGVADLHHPWPGRARTRHLDRRHLADGRGVRLAHRPLRSPAQPHVLGHRQRRAVAGRHAPGRQPLRQLGDRSRRGHRQDPRSSPVPLERFLGLGRGLHANPARRAAGGPHDQEPGAPGARTATSGCSSGAPTASASSTPSRSSSRKCSRASIPRRAGPPTIPRRSRRWTRRSPSVRASGAARTGRRPPSIPRRASCTSPPTRTCAARWSG